MAHEIEGDSAFFAKTPAWHGRGQVLKDAPTIEEAWRIAYPGMLYKLPVQALWPMPDGSTEALPMSECFAIFRDDGTEIGHVGKEMEIFQPWERFKWFEPFIEAGLAELEAGGSLRNGKRMWILAKIKDSLMEVLPGDWVGAYLLLFGGFDGSLSTGGKLTSVRVVCANTEAQAMSEKSVHDFRFRNTKNIRENMAHAQEAIGEALESHAANIEAYRTIARKPMTRAQMETYVRSVFIPSETPDDEVTPQMKTKVQTVIDRLDIQRGLELVPAAKGTAWQAYNAISEYITHDAGRSVDSRLNAQWFGEGVNLNNRALAMALEA